MKHKQIMSSGKPEKKDTRQSVKVQNKRQIGGQYEQMIGRFLEAKGYRILEFNYRCKSGEIDLIAKDGNYLVFIEVKYRYDERKGHPLEAVGKKKQIRISQCARQYLLKNGRFDIPCRFDVIAVLGEEIHHICNAFEYQI